MPAHHPTRSIGSSKSPAFWRQLCLASGLATLWLGLVPTNVTAQVEDPSAASDGLGESTSKPQNKEKRRKRSKKDKQRQRSKKKAGGRSDADLAPSEDRPGENAVAANQPPSPWFPSWTAPGLDFKLAPILDFKYSQSVSKSGGTARSTTLEGGVSGGIVNIPIIAGNPGITLSPYVGYALGGTGIVTSQGSGIEDTGFLRYNRYWTGLETTVYAGWYRHSLDVARGRFVLLSDAKAPSTSTLRVSNDLGILILPWLTAHYSPVFLQAWHNKMAKPFLEQQDHWVHTRIQSSILSFVFDIGPGTSSTKEYAADESGTLLAEGRTNYVLAISQMHFFWKLGGSFRGKYVPSSSSRDLGQHSAERLPEESLNGPTSVALPGDSFYANGFVGVHDLFYGVGVGLMMRMQVLNVAQKGDTERKTTKDYGIGIEQAITF